MVLFLPLHEFKKKVYGFICVGKHSILYCAIPYYRKKTCFCRKDWRFEDLSPFIYFPPQKVLLPFLDEVYCARRIKF